MGGVEALSGMFFRRDGCTCVKTIKQSKLVLSTDGEVATIFPKAPEGVVPQVPTSLSECHAQAGSNPQRPTLELSDILSAVYN